MTIEQGVEELSRGDCIELLRTQTIGRVAVVVDDLGPGSKVPRTSAG